MHHSKSPVIVASELGGVDIEGVAKQSPQRVKKFELREDNARNVLREVADFIGFQNNPEAIDCLERLVKLFKQKDMTLLEINPIVKTDKGKVVCLDAKIQIDDNASFRQKEFFNTAEGAWRIEGGKGECSRAKLY